MKLSTILTLLAIAIGLGFISFWLAQQSYDWFPPAASQEARLIDNLFAFTVFLGTFIFLGVTGTITYSVLTQRVSRFDLTDGPPIEGSLTLEIVWTAIPLLLVFIIAGYSYWTYEHMAVRGPMDLVHLHVPGLESAYAAPMTEAAIEEIEVTAKQWAWAFRYPTANVTSAELHVPVNHRVRLIMRTEDVIHGLYVPAFRLKQDIVPQHTVEFEFTPVREGIYRLSDSQFSGTYFALMQTYVVVESDNEYRQWLATTATRPLAPASNLPYEEYTGQKKPGFKAGWPTVKPAPPPLVNG